VGKLKSKFLFNNTSLEREHLGLISGEVLYASYKGSNKDINQDSLAIFEIEDSIILVIADGMGGTVNGEKASQYICEQLKDLLGRYKKGDILDWMIVDALEQANQKVLNLKHECGSTATCVLIKNNLARFYNIGDSGQFLYNSKKKLLYKGVEHSLVGYGMQAGLIKSREGQEIVEDSILLNGVGFENMKIELSKEYRLRKNDLIILCSDGFFQFFNEFDPDIDYLYGKFLGRGKKLLSLIKDDGIEVLDDCTYLLYRHI